MQNDRVRSILAVLSGLVIGVLVVAFGDSAAGKMAPPPPKDMDFSSQEQLCAYVATIPQAAMAVMLVFQFAAGAVAGWVSNAVASSTRYRPAMIAGAGLLAAAVANLVSVPCHPIWYSALNVILIPLGAWLGGRWALRSFAPND